MILESYNKAKNRSIENAINYCLKRTKKYGKECAFCYNIDYQEITSPIIEGNNICVDDPDNNGRHHSDKISDGHFHTHPIDTHDRFSSQDISALFNCNRKELKLATYINKKLINKTFNIELIMNNFVLLKELVNLFHETGKSSAFNSSEHYLTYDNKEKAMRLIKLNNKQTTSKVNSYLVDIDNLINTVKEE